MGKNCSAEVEPPPRVDVGLGVSSDWAAGVGVAVAELSGVGLVEVLVGTGDGPAGPVAKGGEISGEGVGPVVPGVVVSGEDAPDDADEGEAVGVEEGVETVESGGEVAGPEQPTTTARATRARIRVHGCVITSSPR